MLMNRTDGKEYVLSLSYGKDSLGCLGAIEELGWPLDRIVHAEVWATDTIPADLPPMVEFKAKADAIILERWGIEVEHVCAMTTYERCFYKPITRQAAGFEDRIGLNRGFPYQKGAWCQRDLKVAALNGQRKKTFESDIIYRVMSDKSKRSGEYHGWPMTKGPICQSQLKRNLCRGQRTQFNISASHLTNRGALDSYRIQRSVLLSQPGGQKQCAGSGVRPMTFCRRFTPQLLVAAAGSAITKALTSSASCGTNTRNIGR